MMRPRLRHRLQETADRITTAFALLATGMVIAIACNALGVPL